MTAKKKKKRRGWIWLRYRKKDHGHNLVCAAQHWIHEQGGTAVVIGRIGILDEGAGRYQVCVGVLGKKPEKKE